MRPRLGTRLCRAGGLLALALLLVSCATTQLRSTPPVRQFQGPDIWNSSSPDHEQHGLRVMTLNVAHGRGTAFHQMLQRSNQTVKNLDRIGRLLNQVRPDVIALQEIDGPSFWSGRFNHLEYLARKSVFTRSVQAPHVDAPGLSYGTALMSRLELSNPRAITFDPSLSPMPKGFVVSTVSFPGREGIEVDVVSVHLDFMSRSIRKKQADELIALMRARNNRLIIMGDLNSGWHEQHSAAKYLAEQLDLTAFQPENRTMTTFPALGQRLDWILVSRGFEFAGYEIVGDRVSDHRGVVANLRVTGR